MQTEEPAVVDATSTEIAPVARSTALAVMPQVEASELVARLAVIREAMDTAMTPDVDYGVIPGTNKPALLKPGAEKLSVLFQLDVQVLNVKTWGPGDHLTVESRATVYHAPTGTRLGTGEGMCTTREKKYAVRKQERVCPTCGVPAVIKGKDEFGGGWLCWRKREGCGAKYAAGDASIEGQEVGTVENPDLPDAFNTVVKMAQKRARVDAVLSVTGASALFTQDIEEAEKVDERPIPGPPHGPPVSGDEDEKLRRAIAYVLDGDPAAPAITAVVDKVAGRLGYVSVGAYTGIGVLCGAVKTSRDIAVSDVPTDVPTDVPDPDPDELDAAFNAATTKTAKRAVLRQGGCVCDDPVRAHGPDGDINDACPIHSLPF